MKEKTKKYIANMLERQIEKRKNEINQRWKNINIHKQYKNEHYKVFKCTYEEHMEWLHGQDLKSKEMIKELEEMILEIRSI